MPNISERFDQYAKDFFKEAFNERESDFIPELEIRESDFNYIILAQVPGIEVGDIELHLEDNCLIIEGEKHQNEGNNYLINECSYGHFYRWVPLKEDVDNEAINAELQKGVLKVTLTKKRDGLDDYRKIKILKTIS